MISGDIKNNDELERSKNSIIEFLRLLFYPELTTNIKQNDLTMVHDVLIELINGNNRYEFFERWKQSQDNDVTQKITLCELQRFVKEKKLGNWKLGDQDVQQTWRKEIERYMNVKIRDDGLVKIKADEIKRIGSDIITCYSEMEESKYVEDTMDVIYEEMISKIQKPLKLHDSLKQAKADVIKLIQFECYAESSPQAILQTYTLWKRPIQCLLLDTTNGNIIKLTLII